MAGGQNSSNDLDTIEKGGLSSRSVWSSYCSSPNLSNRSVQPKRVREWQLCAVPMVLGVPTRRLVKSMIGDVVENYNLMQPLILWSYAVMILLAAFQERLVFAFLKSMDCLIVNIYPLFFYFCAAHRVNVGILLKALASFESILLHVVYTMNNVLVVYHHYQVLDTKGEYNLEWKFCDAVHVLVYLPMGTMLACSDALEINQGAKQIVAAFNVVYCLLSCLDVAYLEHWHPAPVCLFGYVCASVRTQMFFGLSVLSLFAVKAFILYTKGRQFSTVRPWYDFPTLVDKGGTPGSSGSVVDSAGEFQQPNTQSDGSDPSDLVGQKVDDVNGGIKSHSGDDASTEVTATMRTSIEPGAARGHRCTVKVLPQHLQEMQREQADMVCRMEEAQHEVQTLQQQIQAAYQAAGIAPHLDLKDAIVNLRRQYYATTKELEREISLQKASETAISNALKAAGVETPKEMAGLIQEWQKRLDSMSQMLMEKTDENNALKAKLDETHRAASMHLFRKACKTRQAAPETAA